MTLSPDISGVFYLCSTEYNMGNDFLAAYSEYLERMLDETHELVTVDVFTVPSDVDPDSPAVQEWAHFE